MYDIKDYTELREFSHIIWDIDGTITEKDTLNQEVTADIISLAHRHGVYHTFITGRDYSWIDAIVMRRIKDFHNFRAVMAKLTFFAEVGSVKVDIDQDGNAKAELQQILRDHPLITNARGIRTKLRALAYDPEQLVQYRKGLDLGKMQDVIYDANGVGYVVEKEKELGLALNDYVWSKYKMGFCTFEKKRDADRQVRTFDQSNAEKVIKSVIADAGYAEEIDTEVVATAINVIPVVRTVSADGIPHREKIGKSWAAGQALNNIKIKSGKRFMDEITEVTIAFGDGASDVEFTTPSFPSDVPALCRTLPIVFVGSDQDLPQPGTSGYEKRHNIIIQATGRGNLEHDDRNRRIDLVPATGPRVVAAVLAFLNTWGYFKALH